MSVLCFSLSSSLHHPLTLFLSLTSPLFLTLSPSPSLLSSSHSHLPLSVYVCVHVRRSEVTRTCCRPQWEHKRNEECWIREPSISTEDRTRWTAKQSWEKTRNGLSSRLKWQQTERLLYSTRREWYVHFRFWFHFPIISLFPMCCYLASRRCMLSIFLLPHFCWPVCTQSSSGSV